MRQLWQELGVRWRWRRQRPLKAKAEEQVALRAELEEWLVAWPEDAELRLVDRGRWAAIRR